MTENTTENNRDIEPIKTEEDEYKIIKVNEKFDFHNKDYIKTFLENITGKDVNITKSLEIENEPQRHLYRTVDGKIIKISKTSKIFDHKNIKFVNTEVNSIPNITKDSETYIVENKNELYSVNISKERAITLEDVLSCIRNDFLNREKLNTKINELEENLKKLDDKRDKTQKGKIEEEIRKLSNFRDVSTKISPTKIMTQLISIIRSLNERGISHNDLKPENLMFNMYGNLKLIDLEMTTNNKDKKITCGTPCYRSIEIESKEGIATEKAENFSLCLIFLEICTNYWIRDIYKTTLGKEITSENLYDAKFKLSNNIENYRQQINLNIIFPNIDFEGQNNHIKDELQDMIFEIIKNGLNSDVNKRSSLYETQEKYIELLDFTFKNVKKQDGTNLTPLDLGLTDKDLYNFGLLEYVNEEYLQGATNKYKHNLDLLTKKLENIPEEKDKIHFKTCLGELEELSPYAKECVKDLQNCFDEDNNIISSEFEDIKNKINKLNDVGNRREYVILSTKVMDLERLILAKRIKKLEKEKLQDEIDKLKIDFKNLKLIATIAEDPTEVENLFTIINFDLSVEEKELINNKKIGISVLLNYAFRTGNEKIIDLILNNETLEKTDKLLTKCFIMAYWNNNEELISFLNEKNNLLEKKIDGNEYFNFVNILKNGSLKDIKELFDNQKYLNSDILQLSYELVSRSSNKEKSKFLFSKICDNEVKITEESIIKKELKIAFDNKDKNSLKKLIEKIYVGKYNKIIDTYFDLSFCKKSYEEFIKAVVEDKDILKYKEIRDLCFKKACKYGNLEIVKKLINESNRKKEDINTIMKEGFRIAYENNQIEAIKILIENNIEIDQEIIDNCFEIACKDDSIELIEILLPRAEQSVEKNKKFIENGFKSAVKNGCIKIFNKLIEKDYIVGNDSLLREVLEVANKNGNSAMIKKILEHKKGLSDKALEFAYKRNNKEFILDFTKDKENLLFTTEYIKFICENYRENENSELIENLLDKVKNDEEKYKKILKDIFEEALNINNHDLMLYLLDNESLEIDGDLLYKCFENLSIPDFGTNKCSEIMDKLLSKMENNNGQLLYKDKISLILFEAFNQGDDITLIQLLKRESVINDFIDNDINIRNSNDNTILCILAVYGYETENKEIIQYLVENGANFGDNIPVGYNSTYKNSLSNFFKDLVDDNYNEKEKEIINKKIENIFSESGDGGDNLSPPSPDSELSTKKYSVKSAQQLNSVLEEIREKIESNRIKDGDSISETYSNIEHDLDNSLNIGGQQSEIFANAKSDLENSFNGKGKSKDG